MAQTNSSYNYFLGDLQLIILFFPISSFLLTFTGSDVNTLTNLLYYVFISASLLYILFGTILSLDFEDHYVLIGIIIFLISSLYWVEKSMVSESIVFTIRTLFTIIQTYVIICNLQERFIVALRHIVISITILSLVFIILFPDLSASAFAENALFESNGRHKSFFASANVLGQFLALAYITINFSKHIQSFTPFIVLINSIILLQLYLCDSITSFIAIIIITIAYYVKRLYKFLAILIICTGVATPFVTHYYININKIDVISIGSRDLTFTGRNEIWGTMITDLFANEKEIQGFGFGGYWSKENQPTGTNIDEYIFKWDILQGHNGYLDILLATGLTGLFLVILFLIDLILKSSKLGNDYTVINLLILAILINNISESSLFRTKHQYFVLLMLCYWFVKEKYSIIKQEKFIKEKKLSSI